MPRVTAKEEAEILARQTCSVEDLAKVLGCGRSQAYEMVNQGQIRSIRIGRRVLIPTVAIREVLTGTSAV